MLDRSSHGNGQSSHESASPPMRNHGSCRRRLDSAQNEFQCSLAEKLGECELSENATDQKWTSISSALHEAAAHTIGFESENHQDWFDNNSDTIQNSLNAMHKAHQVSLKNPSSSTARELEEKCKGPCGACRTSGGWKRHRRSSHKLIEMTCTSSTMQSNLSMGHLATASLP